MVRWYSNGKLTPRDNSFIPVESKQDNVDQFLNELELHENELNLGSALLEAYGLTELYGIKLGDVFTTNKATDSNYFFTVSKLDNDHKQLTLTTSGQSKFIMPYSKFPTYDFKKVGNEIDELNNTRINKMVNDWYND